MEPTRAEPGGTGRPSGRLRHLVPLPPTSGCSPPARLSSSRCTPAWGPRLAGVRAATASYPRSERSRPSAGPSGDGAPGAPEESGRRGRGSSGPSRSGCLVSAVTVSSSAALPRSNTRGSSGHVSISSVTPSRLLHSIENCRWTGPSAGRRTRWVNGSTPDFRPDASCVEVPERAVVRFLGAAPRCPADGGRRPHHRGDKRQSDLVLGDVSEC